MDSKPTAVRRLWIGAALILVQVLFGVHYLAAKSVLLEIPARAWALLRVLGAATVLITLTGFTRRRSRPSVSDIGMLALLSLFGVVINQICFVEGLARTTPTHSSLMNTMIPLLTMVFAVLLRRELLEARKVLALALGLAGVLVILRPGSDLSSPSMRHGDLLTLANGASYALFLVLSRRTLTRVDPLAATTLLLAFGMVGIAAVGLPQLLALDLQTIGPRTWNLAIFIIVGPTAGAYLLSYWALARVESSQVALFIYLQPVIAAGLSAALLGERLSPAVLWGAALIFAGVYLALAPRSRFRLQNQPRE